MSQKSKLVVNEFLEKFTEDDVKLDLSHRPYLINHIGAVKEAVSLLDPKGIKLIRGVVKDMEVSISIDKIKTVLVPELEGVAWDNTQAKISPSMRYAKSDDDQAVILDLYNDANQVVEIKAGSVQILDTLPASNDDVYFQRPDYMKPMVTPKLPQDDEKVGLSKLRPFINTDDRTFFILLAYMTYVMSNPKSCGLPYPILMIQGEKGSGKSFFCNNVIRNLIDPISLDGMSMPLSEDVFTLQLNSMYLTVFDNLRKLNKNQSDLLCKAATKSATTKRTLYTTTGMTGLALHSPMVLNGIHDFVQESDLADRCFRVYLKPMSQDKRRTEQELKAEFTEAMPEILGALLTLASKIMVELPDTKVKYASRMMDMVQWTAAFEKVWSLPEGLLQKAYRANVKELMADGTADDSLTLALQKLLKKVGKGKVWKGSASHLLETLQELENYLYLPKAPAALSTKLFGQESSFNANGIFIKKGRGTDRFILVADHQI